MGHAGRGAATAHRWAELGHLRLGVAERAAQREGGEGDGPRHQEHREEAEGREERRGAAVVGAAARAAVRDLERLLVGEGREEARVVVDGAEGAVGAERLEALRSDAW